jgi:hypothetical protein
MAGRAGFERWVVAGFAAATVAAIVAPVAGRGHAWAGGLVALATFAGTPRAASALPASLDGVRRRRRVVSILWALLATLGVLQMGRLSAFMADATREWGATVPEPLSTRHACLSAYVYAAELSRQGVENLYEASWYPLFDPPGPTCRLVTTSTAGLGPWVSDPYMYPPPFLLLPRAALALTPSFDAIRAWWFVLQALALIAAGVMLARWVGGSAGLTIGLLIPAVLASLETMFGLQFGNFHAMAVVLAVAGMAAFQERRHAAGGVLLSAAILAKMFPAILLVVLAARRQWRSLAWTAAAGAAFTLLGLAVLGPSPFRAFIQYELPRIASGAAFQFTHQGQHEVFIVSRNFSVARLGAKLALLGAPAAAIHGVRALSWIYAMALLALAVTSAPRAQARTDCALVWIGLLDLAALGSPIAPSAYVLAPVLWLLVLLATRVRGRRGLVAALALTWMVIVGPPPLPDRVDLVVGIFCQAFTVALCGVAVALVFSVRRPAA